MAVWRAGKMVAGEGVTPPRRGNRAGSSMRGGNNNPQPLRACILTYAFQRAKRKSWPRVIHIISPVSPVVRVLKVDRGAAWSIMSAKRPLI